MLRCNAFIKILLTQLYIFILFGKKYINKIRWNIINITKLKDFYLVILYQFSNQAKIISKILTQKVLQTFTHFLLNRMFSINK